MIELMTFVLPSGLTVAQALEIAMLAGGWIIPLCAVVVVHWIREG
tara:strand:- start:758 stop:892 length:135 start_codon:yes stop_codon:yes gene_type:complete